MNPHNPQFAPRISLPFQFFLFAFLCFGSFGILLPLYAKEILSQHHYTHHAIALTHLITLGWITTIIFGAMIQLVPVALGAPLHSERLAQWTFIFHSIGVTGMILSFWFWHFSALLWFGIPLTLGLFTFIYNMARTLIKVPSKDWVAIHIATALAYLLLTLFTGQYLMHDKVKSFSPFNALSTIHAHAHLAFLGWFVMMVVGISYRLIPMFTLSNIQNTRRIFLSFLFLNLGIPSLFVAILMQKSWAPIPVIFIGLGLGFWLWEMAAIFIQRKRIYLDLVLKHVRLAMIHLPVLILFGLWLSWPEKSPSLFKLQSQTGYGLLAFMGFLSLFILAILYKIIPFLVWYKIYPPLVGHQPVPQLQDLYSARWAKWGQIFFITGTWMTIISSSFGHLVSAWLLQTCASVMGIGILLNIVTLLKPICHLLNQKIQWRFPFEKSFAANFSGALHLNSETPS